MPEHESHKAVRHPFKGVKGTSDRFMSWVADKVLASPAMFYVAFTLPLLALPMSDSVKLLLGALSGSWIQWWALSAIQRRQNEINLKQDLKADSDHETLTYLAEKVDRVESILLHPSSKRDNSTDV